MLIMILMRIPVYDGSWLPARAVTDSKIAFEMLWSDCMRQVSWNIIFGTRRRNKIKNICCRASLRSVIAPLHHRSEASIGSLNANSHIFLYYLNKLSQ
jgi:hypothetical protein